MLSKFRNLISAPPSSQGENPQRLALINTALLICLLMTLLWAWYPIFIQGGTYIIFPIALIAVVGSCYLLFRYQKIKLVQILLPSLLWLVGVGYLFVFGGVRNSGFLILSLVVILAGLIDKPKTALIYTGLGIFAGIVFVLIENQGLLPSYTFETRITTLLSYSIVLLIIGLFTFTTSRSLMHLSSEKSATEEEANTELTSLEKDLSSQADRLPHLEQRHRTVDLLLKFLASSSEMTTENHLFEHTFRLLKETWLVDHIGIFLFNEERSSMVLKYTNTPQGVQLLENHYSLKVSSSMMQGPLVSKEFLTIRTGDRSLFLETPQNILDTKFDLPLPLFIADDCVGLLDLQFFDSNPPLPDGDSTAVFIRIVGLLLERARNLENTGLNKYAGTHSLEQASIGEWKAFEEGQILGYRYDRVRVDANVESLPDDVLADISQNKTSTYVSGGAHSSAHIVVPIVLGGKAIGVIGYEDPDHAHVWLPPERAMLETIASRVSLALENSRLVAEAEMRAERERIYGHITTRMRETLDLDTILQTALKELHLNFPVNEAEVHLQVVKPENKPGD